MVIILKLCHGKEVSPVILPFTTEEPQVLLQFLVYPFRLPVRLWVVSHGLSHFNP
jgi:hypothetical protein